MLSVQIISDSDLDGIVSAFIIEYALKLKGNYQVSVQYTRPSTIDVVVHSLAEKEIDWVIFTDLCPKDVELLKLFNGRVTIIDHHRTGERRYKDAESFETYIDASGAHSAASLALKYSKERILTSDHPKYLQLNKLDRLAELTRDWDLWILAIPESRILALASEVLSPREMASELKNCLDDENTYNFPPTWINRVIYYAYKIALKEIEASEELAVQTTGHRILNWNGVTFHLITAVCFGYGSVVADFLNRSNGGDNVILLLDLKERQFRIRTNRNDVDLSKIAELFDGGGHPKAAGFTHETAFASFFKNMGRFGDIITQQMIQLVEKQYETVS